MRTLLLSCLLVSPAWGAWSLGATGTWATQQGSVDDNVTPVNPTHAIGNTLILGCAVASDGGFSVATPSGWTLLESSQNAANSEWIYAFGLQATSASETDPTCTATGLTGNDMIAGVVLTFTGGGLTEDVASQNADNGAATETNFTGLTPSSANTLVLIVLGIGDADIDEPTNPSTFTSAFYQDTGTGQDVGLGIKYVIQTTATAVSTGTMSHPMSGSSPGQTVTIALQEAAGGGGRRRRQ